MAQRIENFDLPAESRCPVCQHAFSGLTKWFRPSCDNRICRNPQRGFGTCYATAVKSGHVEGALTVYKYRTAPVHARARADALADVMSRGIQALGIPIRDYSVIIPMPSYVDRSRRAFDHVALLVERLNHIVRANPLPILTGDDSPIRKTAQTSQMMNASGWDERERIAVEELRPALDVVDPEAIRGESVLVVDDVFTTGHSLREVALKALGAGASMVDGLVLCRAQWRLS